MPRSRLPVVTETSIRGLALPRELLRRLDERGVGRRQDHVGALELLSVEQRALAADQREQLLEALVERVLVAAVDRLDDAVVEVVEAVGVLVGEAVLTLRRDADDHACPSLPGSSAGVSVAVPWPSSAFIFARSSSTALCDVSSWSWRSMSSPPPPSARLSSKAPEASSSSIAPARARMFSVLSCARCIASPTSAISSPTPVAASEIFTEASAAEYCALMTSFFVRNWSIFVRSCCSFWISVCC